MEPPCPETLTFDIAQTAGYYSQLAGVLAGFAFTALVLLLTQQLARQRRSLGAFAEVAKVLLAAFISLVVASVTQAVLGGEEVSSGRAASAGLFAGVGFAVAAGLLVYAIVLTLEAVEPGSDVAVFFRTVFVLVVTPLLLNALRAITLATSWLRLLSEDSARDDARRSPPAS